MNCYVNIDGEWINTEDPEIVFLDISEGPMGEDQMTFEYQGETYTRTVYRRR